MSSWGIRMHNQYEIVEVRKTWRYPKFDQFVLAQHASQVYYVPYPERIRDKLDWLVVIKTRPRKRIDKDHTIENSYQDQHPKITGAIFDNDPIGLLLDINGAFQEIDDDDLGKYTTVGTEEEEQEQEQEGG
ncbi:hypothetical protein ACH5RR_025972 [Cinchona calisaya]|uniref:DUF4216 domain-containing protein n=1 Tax=Cinchona calisaya TaxID=153742 RepID=A0ABD2Z4K0_9GENT